MVTLCGRRKEKKKRKFHTTPRKRFRVYLAPLSLSLMAGAATLDAPQTTQHVEPTNSVDPIKRQIDGSDKNGGDSKKQKVDNEGVMSDSGRVGLGMKSFGSSLEMYEYFFRMIHHWPLCLNLNKYEHMMLLELLNKGHPEPEKKIGKGVQAFQVRIHPEWKSKCFFIIRNDESAEDFSFRKCVDTILPLPENMQIKNDVNKKLGGRDFGHGGRRGGGRGGGGRGRGHFRGGGRGRSGKPRN